jgi:hypothetical protein
MPGQQEAWFQQVLLDAEVLELTVRIGVIRSRDHVQWTVELKDPTDSRLIDMKSDPHSTFAQLWAALTVAFDTGQHMLEDNLEPF